MKTFTLNFLTNKSSNKILYLIIFFFAFILFHSFFEEVLNKFLVIPFFEKLIPSIINDAIFILLFILIFYRIYRKISLNYQSSSYTLMLSFIVLVTLSYYRFSSTFWYFIPLKSIYSIKYVDAVIFYLSTDLIVVLFTKNKKYNVETQKGFFFDNPIKRTEEDSLNRNAIAENIAEKIKNTAHPDSSFAIGINSEWGWGKTSFLNLIEKKLIDSNRIIIHFNPWLNNDEKAIVSSFFDELSTELKRYNKELSDELIRYGKMLNASTSDGTQVFNIFLNQFDTPKNLRQRFDDINYAIQKSGLQLVIFIDDLDRLYENEISEVLKLVRNSASFSNTVFIVAFDRNFLISALKEINKYHPEFYLEKIFQFELALPTFDNKIIIENLKKQITPHLREKDITEFDKIIAKSIHPDSWFHGNYFNFELLSNLRDVNRFVNSFIISYDTLKGEIVLTDLLNLELLKVKFLGVFNLLVSKYSDFLESHTIGNQFYLALKNKKDDNDKDTGRTVLEDYLKIHYKNFGIQKNQIDTVLVYVRNIFPIYNNYSSAKIELLSIANPISIDRYFYYNLLSSNLSEIEFSKARITSIEEFQAKIKVWIEKGFEYEIERRLKNIDFFANKEDYEKIIESIFFYATYAKDKDDKYLNFDLSNLNEKLKFNKVKIFYTQDEFKEFVTNSFKNQASPYLFISTLINYICDDQGALNWEFILSKEELRQFKIEYFKKYADETTETDFKMFHLFHYCKYTEYNSIGGSSYERHEIFPLEAKEIFKSHAKKLPNSFLKNIISLNKGLSGDLKLYSILNTVKVIWENWDEFENFLNELSVEQVDYLDEFKEFYSKCKEVEFKRYIEFDFKTIDLSNALLFCKHSLNPVF
ncbi:MAG: P-loop NTPase fold protein [Draconibacterium sp.]